MFIIRLDEAASLLSTLIKTQPKDGSDNSSEGKSKEEIVCEKTQELLNGIPEPYDHDFVKERIQVMGGGHIPLNIFLQQEIERFQKVIDLVSLNLNQVIQAIQGEIIVTPLVLDIIQSIFDAQVPHSWVENVAGDEISWRRY